MAKAEGRILKTDGVDAINADLLEVFDYTGSEQLIEYKTDEFSAVCPFSGLPDYANLSIKYIPDKVCIELKSLKYYIISFRNVGIYQEAATAIIFENIKKILEPKYLYISLDYNVRGGILSHTEMILGNLPNKYKK